ncbi:MAG: orotidine-5'-phosphate decarboxylase [Gemmatimonadota bacterium]
MSELIVALDVPSRERALELVDRLGGEADFYKVGLELFTREGPSVVTALQDRGKRIFLDLKLMDIPNTVAATVAAASDLGVELLTVHAQGGARMIEAAVAQAGTGTRLLAVTVLTSLSPDEIETVWDRPVGSVRSEVLRLARLARSLGIHGVVASPLEAGELRTALGPEALVVTPGIRPSGTEHHDQNRVATPEAAVEAGASHLVVGRAITRAPDPAEAARRVRAAMRAALEGRG